MLGNWSTTNNQAASNRARRETLLKIDFRVQGVAHNAVLEGQRRATKIEDLVHTFGTQFRTEFVVTDLSKTNKFNTFLEEFAKIIQKIGENSNYLK